MVVRKPLSNFDGLYGVDSSMVREHFSRKAISVGNFTQRQRGGGNSGIFIFVNIFESDVCASWATIEMTQDPLTGM
jgi:hypothetical protein